MPSPTASHRSIAADVIVQLLHFGVIPNTKSNISGIESLVGITMEELADANRRRWSDGWKSFKLSDETFDRRKTRPKVKPKKRPDGVGKSYSPPRKSQVVDGVNHLWCTAAKGQLGEPHFAPEDQFIPKSDRPWTRHSLCDTHRSMYQRARHVKTAARRKMNQVGIEIQLDKDSNVVGLMCAVCQKPFAPGDTVSGGFSPHHSTCV